MYFSYIRLKNWKNFGSISVPLTPRVFLVGANASGKSNLLDAFRFLRDIAKTDGGLQPAVNKERGGLSKIRCLAARAPNTDVEIEIAIADDSDREVFRYELAITQRGRGARGASAPIIRKEAVYVDGQRKLLRPDRDDDEDPTLLEYTHLEQPTANREFRELAEFLQGVEYLHVVPQLIRDADTYHSSSGKEDFFGKELIEKIQKKNSKTRESFLKKINSALSNILPQFEDLKLEKDEMGRPHLVVRYKHWRDRGARQNETQFSDGTLRFIGLFWALLDGNKPILLEEPELSLHAGVVSWLPEVISKMQKKDKNKKRQVILSTHSTELLSSETIGIDEVLVLTPGKESTEVDPASNIMEIKTMMESGFRVSDAVIPKTRPSQIDQIARSIL